MKKISPGTVTVGVLAILFGLVAIYAVRRALEEKPIEETGVQVVVSSINLPKHARLFGQNLRVVRMDPADVPDDAFLSLSRAVGRLMANSLPAGEPVTERDLYPMDDEPLLSNQVPAGHRAVTFQVESENALAGVLLPESVIDVALTAQSDNPDYPGTVTRTLVRAVKVLATNQQRYRFSENSNRQLRTITVSATPEDANKLILGQQYGNLSVTLRNESEDFHLVAEYKDDLISVNDLLGMGPPRRDQNRQFTTQIWRGTSMSEVTFQGNRIDEAERATIAAENAAPIDPLGFRGRAPVRRPETDRFRNSSLPR